MLRVKPKETSDPDKFDGSRTALKKFKNQLSLVLAEQNRFTDEQHRLRYCFGLLKGEAYTTLEPFIGNNGQISFEDTAAFLAEITNIFADSDEKATASRELDKLKQGTRDFARYHADFVRLTTILECTEETKKLALERGLSSDMLAGLKYQDAPAEETLTQFEARLRRLDDRIRRDRVLNKPQSSQAAPRPSSRPAAASTPSTATGTHSGPMDLSSARKKLEPAERARRMAEGLCLYCGGTGHLARECPNRPSARPDALRAAATAAPESPPAPAVSSAPAPVEPSGNGHT
jgi:hypothetical protein